MKMESIPPQQLLDFSDKVVIVTGAGKGIGPGIALRFAEAGANVVVNYRSSQAGADSVVRQIVELEKQAIAVRGDMTERGEVEQLIGLTIDRFGTLHVMVNNAGIYPLASLLDMTDEQWDLVINTNLRSVHLGTQIAAQRMIESGSDGSIINIATIEAENPAAQHSHYDAAKAGVVMHTRNAARELGPHGIRVNSVSPGLIWTEGLDEDWPDGVQRYLAAAPLARLGQADDVADACLFLASPAARWITGANLIVDGGVLTSTVF